MSIAAKKDNPLRIWLAKRVIFGMNDWSLVFTHDIGAGAVEYVPASELSAANARAEQLAQQLAAMRFIPDIEAHGIKNSAEAMRKALRAEGRLSGLSEGHPAAIVRELCKIVIEAEQQLATVTAERDAAVKDAERWNKHQRLTWETLKQAQAYEEAIDATLSKDKA